MCVMFNHDWVNLCGEEHSAVVCYALILLPVTLKPRACANPEQASPWAAALGCR